MSDHEKKPGGGHVKASGAVIGLGWLSIAAFEMARNGITDSWEVGSVIAIVAVFVLGGVMYVSFRGALALGCVLVVAGSGFAIGVLAWSPSSADGARGSAKYAKQVGEVLRDLRKAVDQAHAGSAAITARLLYADRAQQMSEAFEKASAALARLRIRRADRRAHWRLVARLEETSQAYDHLAETVADRYGGQPKIDSALEAVRAAGRKLREAEEALEQNGYRLLLRVRGQAGSASR